MFFTRLPIGGTILHVAARHPTTIQPVEKPESTDQFDLFHAFRNDFRTIAVYNRIREVVCDNYS
jgi:hypothetical protein